MENMMSFRTVLVLIRTFQSEFNDASLYCKFIKNIIPWPRIKKCEILKH